MTQPLDTAIIEWATTQLTRHGYTSFPADYTVIQHTPWSCVIQFQTAQGLVYLKKHPPALALEAALFQRLRDTVHAPVPEVIAENSTLSCFLMKDAGQTLRSLLKKQFNPELVCRAIDAMSTLQSSTAHHIDVLINIGVPDWRLEYLPHLFEQLLLQKKLLIDDGLSESESIQLNKLVPVVSQLSEKISRYAIKPTLVQPDFNDNNTLMNEKTHAITIIDLGEIVISHPFFSLLNMLYQIKKHHGLKKTDDVYRRIREHALNHYLDVETRENISTIFQSLYPLWFVYGALASYRLMNACGREKMHSLQRGKLSGQLKAVITICRDA